MSHRLTVLKTAGMVKTVTPPSLIFRRNIGYDLQQTHSNIGFSAQFEGVQLRADNWSLVTALSIAKTVSHTIKSYIRQRPVGYGARSVPMMLGVKPFNWC